MKRSTLSFIVVLTILLAIRHTATFARQDASSNLGSPDVNLTGEEAQNLLFAWQQFLKEPHPKDVRPPTDILRYQIRLYRLPGFKDFTVMLDLDGRETKQLIPRLLNEKPIATLSGGEFKALMVTCDYLAKSKIKDHNLCNYSFNVGEEHNDYRIMCSHSNCSVLWTAVDAESQKPETTGIFGQADLASKGFDINRKTFNNDNVFPAGG